jgi:iron(III) transport system permease protein
MSAASPASTLRAYTVPVPLGFYAWLGLALLGCLLLPWYAQQDQASWYNVLGRTFTADQDSANALIQGFQLGRTWLLAAPLALLLAIVTAFTAKTAKGQGAGWLIAGLLGLGFVMAFGFLIGMKGWQYDWLNASFGALSIRQFGMGAGAACVLLGLLMIAATGFARLGYFKSDIFISCSVWLCSALLLVFIALPLSKSLWSAMLDDTGTSLDLTAGISRIFNHKIWGLDCLAGGSSCGVAWNTIVLGLLVAAGTTVLGTMLALLAERGPKRMDKPLRILALLPIITPPFVVGLGLILLFGRAGIANQLLEWGFGIEPSRWFYGFFGVWVAQMFAFTPIAFLMMRGVIQGISPSLEEAAQTLNASPQRTFMTITLPLLKPGLLNAFLVGFIESMADFGNPIVLGGNFSVLSTEIFFAIVGAQLDQGRAAALAILLTSFALAVFFIKQRMMEGQSFTTVTGKGDGGIPLALPPKVKRIVFAVCIPWLVFTAVIYVFAFVGGFVQTWGRDYTPTLAHVVTAFDIQWGEHGIVWAGAAWNSLFTTIKLAAASAPLTAALGLLMAWLAVRTTFKGQKAFEFASLLAFAIPGTVLGVAYVLAFNVPPIELTGTGLIIILCFMFRNLPVSVQAGTAAFKQIDRSLDEASSMLRANSTTTIRRVLLPLLRPALVAGLIYAFVRSMTTISAVIFLVTAEYELATTFIIGRIGNGDYGVALAYCTFLIVFMLLAVGLIQWLVGERKGGRRAGAVPVIAPVAAG